MAQKKKQRQAAVRLDPAIWKALRRLAADKETTAKDLTEKALRRAYPQLQTEDGAAA